MRDKWFADGRDLVKWGVLVSLAELHGAAHILQVHYWRPTQWPTLEIDRKPVPIPGVVLRRFRHAAAASEIETGARVEVVTEPFIDRRQYLDSVLARIRARTAKPGIVFLDPDTGLEPRSATLDHVLESELAAVWRALEPGDILVFYQHQSNRSGRPWTGPKKEQFELAIGLAAGAAKLALGKGIAPDVAFFYARKPDREAPLSTTALAKEPMAAAQSLCPACRAGVPLDGPRECPECRHRFRGNGWDGIDAHWRAKHDVIVSYEDFWRSLCDRHRAPQRK